MMIYNKETKPRFKKIVDEVNLILLSSNNIQSFPFSITKVIKEKTGIVCRNYEKAETYGVDISAFGSEDAIIHNFRGRFIIFFNDAPYIMNERKKFSLGHEFGHYMMNHDLNNKSDYSLYEVEANFFAAQLLMPEQVINELRRRGMQITQEYLQRWFGVSKSAAKKRIETLRKVDYTHRTDEEKEMDNYIVSKFQDFINKIAPISNSFLACDTYDEEKMQNERDHWY